MQGCKHCISIIKDENYKWNAFVCAMAKSEESYLKEWIEHHLKIGFEHICIIDNNNDDYDLDLFFYDISSVNW